MEIDKNILSKIEALLFIYGEPIEIKKIAKTLNLNEDEVLQALSLMEIELNREERGLALIRDKERIQLTTKPSVSNLLESLVKQEFTEDLTPAALETLSIVAYNPMITRADLEYIRGVNSSFILRNLLMRGLIERSVSSKRGNAYVYNMSFDLLKRLGLVNNEGLPEFKKYNDLVKLLYQEALQQSSEQPTEPTREIGPENISN